MENSSFDLMGKAPVPKAILKLAIPTVLSTIVSLLYNLTDTYFIGLLDDPIQLGAISLAFPVFMVIQAIGNIFGNGAPSYLSRCLGAKRYDEVRNISSVSIYSSVIATLGISALFFLFKDPILRGLGTSPDTIGPTESYLNIIVGFSFVLTLQVLMPALLRSEGKIKEAVTGMIIGTVLNIVLDPVFILVFKQGVAGAAWATIIGNVVAVTYYIFVYLKSHTMLSIRTSDFKPSKQIYSQILKIGLPTSFSQILMSFTAILVNNLAATYGDYVISAYGVAGKLSSMIFMIIIGYVSGYMPFAAYNFGANNMKRMISAFKFTLLTSTGICLFLLLPYIFFASTFMRLFTSNEQIIETGMMILRAQAWSVPILGIQISIMCTFQATGSAIQALIVNLGRQSIFYIPFIYLFNHLWGLQGLTYSYMTADYITSLAAVLLVIPLVRKLIKQAAA